MNRLEAREEALRLLYEADQAHRGPDLDSPELSPRARHLVEGIWQHRAELDEALGRASARWRVERMPAVDRNVLRIGLYELRYRPDTPVAVVISEAVRLAKAYSTERSGGFVNGVLGRLADSERGETRHAK
ncbi:MAG: transcription antitermination factor NusB [Acidimicrobiia bacterium]